MGGAHGRGTSKMGRAHGRRGTNEMGGTHSRRGISEMGWQIAEGDQ